jgi:[CysO sulfur-carrier protein]-S-L-cysteine hydrolase
MLRLDAAAHAAMVAHALAAYPEEACGLLVGPHGGDVTTGFVPCRNVAASARIYSIDPREHLRAERDAEDVGLEIVGVMHSHTHTEPWPSPTDVAQAPDPGWHYVIVGLRRSAPDTRSYAIVDGEIRPEAIELGRAGPSERPTATERATEGE